ncbi:MAG: 3-hydroxyacyl-CoA dehydrogenase [Planctomycetaceae bacterium]
MLYALNPAKNRILRCDTDGNNEQTVVNGLDRIPDGLVIDEAKRHIYFTQMGKPNWKEQTAFDNDGSIWRVGMDGTSLTCIVHPGGTRTPKQITADFAAKKLYWCDREGMRVMRCNLDGSRIETLVETGRVPEDERDMARWCVGIAVDSEAGFVYWTQKGTSDTGEGSIRRAGVEIPAGETARNRSDVEVLFDNLPEAIDLELDKQHGYLYWTDRGNLPGGNSVCRAKFASNGSLERDHEVIVEGTGETIGVAFDHAGGNMYITAINGDLYRAAIQGGLPEKIGNFGMLTGIAFVA